MLPADPWPRTSIVPRATIILENQDRQVSKGFILDLYDLKNEAEAYGLLKLAEKLRAKLDRIAGKHDEVFFERMRAQWARKTDPHEVPDTL